MSFQRSMFRPMKTKKYLSTIAVLLLLILFIWTLGLFAFVNMIPDGATEKNRLTDAIVVLTGGSDRLKQGLNLLTEKRAKKLFVSGVYLRNDVRRLLSVQQHNPAEVLCCISLGYAATSTAENAIETAGWIKKHGYISIRLVTASYHMPRSLIEFQHIMPNIEIIPHPVFPKKFKRARWWAWPGTIALIISEYSKYIITSTVKNLDKVWRALAPEAHLK